MPRGEPYSNVPESQINRAENWRSRLVKTAGSLEAFLQDLKGRRPKGPPYIGSWVPDSFIPPRPDDLVRRARDLIPRLRAEASRVSSLMETVRNRQGNGRKGGVTQSTWNGVVQDESLLRDAFDVEVAAEGWARGITERYRRKQQGKSSDREALRDEMRARIKEGEKIISEIQKLIGIAEEPSTTDRLKTFRENMQGIIDRIQQSLSEGRASSVPAFNNERETLKRLRQRIKEKRSQEESQDRSGPSQKRNAEPQTESGQSTGGDTSSSVPQVASQKTTSQSATAGSGSVWGGVVVAVSLGALVYFGSSGGDSN